MDLIRENVQYEILQSATIRGDEHGNVLASKMAETTGKWCKVVYLLPFHQKSLQLKLYAPKYLIYPHINIL